MFQSEIALARVGVEIFSLYHTHVRTKGDRIMQRFFSALPYVRTLQQLGSIACAALLLVACGSGGGGGGGGTPPAAAPSSGVFIDGPVMGLGYSTTSGLSGSTNAAGEFTYRPGDMMTFNLGGRTVGNSVPGAPEITSLQVFGATSIADPRVVNLAQLFLGLGQVVNNVTQLPSTIPAALPNPLNFSDPNFDTILQAAEITLATEGEANAHLQGSFSTVSVTMSGPGSGNVTSNPSGINCSSGTCSAVFIKNKQFTLSPTGLFVGWSAGTGNAGACDGSTVACIFTLAADSSTTATFNVPPPPTLTILPNLSSGVGNVTCSTDNGANFGGCAPSYTSGTAVILKATADVGSTFTGWTNGTFNATVCNNSTANCPIALNVDSAVRANFVSNAETQFSVTVPINPVNGGGGTVLCNPGPCGGSFAAGTQITVTANPNLVSTFANWTNATGSAVTANCTTNTICGPFQLTDTTTITANFKRPTLTVNVVGSGTVNSNQASITNCTTNCSAPFDKGTSITLTTSSAGFSGWSGGGCSGTGACGPILLTADTTVTATFSAVSQVTNFKFIGAPGQQLLAIDPRSPAATPPAIKVNNATVTVPVGSDGAGSTIVNGTYNRDTKSFENLVADTILFHSQGKLYRASTKLSDGVPGNGSNEPVQVSSRSTTTICGAGSILDPTNQNPIVGYSDAGANGICNDADDFIVLMHLQDPNTTAATLLPIGTTIEGDTAVYNLANGSLDHVMVVKGTGDLQWMGDNMIPADIPGGTGIGIGTRVTIVARQADKVFLANNKNLYIYNPVTHTLNAVPVQPADPGQTWVLNQNRNNEEPKIPADGTAIYPVQTNGKVFKVLLTTATATTLFTPLPPITKAADVEQTANRIIIHTGTRPFGNNGVADPCVAANNCTNGIIAVSKTNGQFVEIEPAASAKQINNLMSFNDYVLYTAFVPGVSGGAFARDENATNPRIDRQGYWSNGVLNKTLNVVSNQQSVLRAILVEPPLCTPQCVVNGTLVKAFDSPTTITPRTLGTVSDTGLLQFAPFFRKSINNGMIGTANLAANPLFNQPFFVDTTVPSSLVKIPTVAANWRDIGSNLE